DPVAVSCFHEVYSAFVVRALEELISACEIDLVLMARMSVGRVATVQWHPTDFWQRCLRVLQSNAAASAGVNRAAKNCKNRSFQVMIFPPQGLRRRALIDANLRRHSVQTTSAGVGDSLQTNPSRHSHDQAQGYALNKPIQNVLVLDDVLTSGGSLLREWKALCAWAEIDPNALSPEFQLHALTLFRTPVMDPTK
ncbi:hypothetical protein EBU99_08505, partial [bacterium]|nr:hypothetical protein [bacterium]